MWLLPECSPQGSLPACPSSGKSVHKQAVRQPVCSQVLLWRYCTLVASWPRSWLYAGWPECFGKKCNLRNIYQSHNIFKAFLTIFLIFQEQNQIYILPTCYLSEVWREESMKWMEFWKDEKSVFWLLLTIKFGVSVCVIMYVCHVYNVGHYRKSQYF